MASLPEKIKAHLGREVNFRTEIVVRNDNDGRGAYISEWNAPEPQPREEELYDEEKGEEGAVRVYHTVMATSLE